MRPKQVISQQQQQKHKKQQSLTCTLASNKSTSSSNMHPSIKQNSLNAHYTPYHLTVLSRHKTTYSWRWLVICIVSHPCRKHYTSLLMFKAFKTLFRKPFSNSFENSFAEKHQASNLSSSTPRRTRIPQVSALIP